LCFCDEQTLPPAAARLFTAVGGDCRESHASHALVSDAATCVSLRLHGDADAAALPTPLEQAKT
jgi:hypothetical protein